MNLLSCLSLIAVPILARNLNSGPSVWGSLHQGPRRLQALSAAPNEDMGTALGDGGQGEEERRC